MAKNENLIRIFEYALNQEKTGLSFFETSLQRMDVGDAVSAFNRIIEEEKRHIAYINSILKRLKQEEALEAPGQDEIALEPTNYFDERARKEFLEQCVQESMVPDVTVFNTAWLIEKDLSEFYQRMATKTEGPAREALEMLARWEAGHEIFFREFRDRLSEVYSEMPWGG